MCSAPPASCAAGPFPRFTGKRAPDGQEVWQGWSETHTSVQAWSAEETLRGLTSPGKTTVRQETHRQGWRAPEFRTCVLAPLPLGAAASTKKTPADTRPEQAPWALPLVQASWSVSWPV